MVVHNLTVVGLAISPDEAQPPLVVDGMSDPIASSRLPGGWSRSSRPVAAANARSLRRDTLARSLGKPFGIRSAQIAAVRLSAKDRITPRYVARIWLAFNGTVACRARRVGLLAAGRGGRGRSPPALGAAGSIARTPGCGCEGHSSGLSRALCVACRVQPSYRLTPTRRNSGSVCRRSTRTSVPIRRRSISQRRLPGSHCPPARRIK